MPKEMTTGQPSTPSTQPDTADTEILLGVEAEQSWSQDNRKLIILAIAVAVFMAIAHFTPLRAWITNVQVWKGHIRSLGWVAHAGFGLTCAASVLVGVPRLPLCAVAGLVFGFWEGLCLSLLGSTLGSYGVFVVARLGGRRAALKRADRWPWVQPLLKKPSLFKVFWTRQLMLPGIVLNVLFGVTGVAHATFMLGTALGYLPMNIAFTLVGSGLGKESLARTLMQLLAAMGVVNVLAWMLWKIAKRKE